MRQPKCKHGIQTNYCYHCIERPKVKPRPKRVVSESPKYLDLMDTGLVYGYPRGHWSYCGN